MAKKQGTKPRAQVKDLPKKRKKLSSADMKKVKGGQTVLSIAGHEITHGARK